MASRTIGETRAQSGHSRSSNSIIATFVPTGGLKTEVSLNAVAPLDGIAICAPAGITNTKAKAITKCFIVESILSTHSVIENLWHVMLKSHKIATNLNLSLRNLMSVHQPGKKETLPEAAANREPHQIYGTGEMADLTRAYDWSITPVGPVEQWPEALITTVNTILGSRHPMFLWWGEEHIQFYNDAYRPSIREDKHPSALGQRGEECWTEIWPIIGPQIEAVMARGEASWYEDQLVPTYRNGKLEDVYWTYGYSPVRSVRDIRGVLVVCTETTETVMARQLLQQETERLADLFNQAPAFFAVLNGPRHVFELTNPDYENLIGSRNIIGKTVSETVPEAEEQGFIALLDRVYQTGEPFVGRGTPIRLARGPARALELRYL